MSQPSQVSSRGSGRSPIMLVDNNVHTMDLQRLRNFRGFGDRNIRALEDARRHPEFGIERAVEILKPNFTRADILHILDFQKPSCLPVEADLDMGGRMSRTQSWVNSSPSPSVHKELSPSRETSKAKSVGSLIGATATPLASHHSQDIRKMVSLSDGCRPKQSTQGFKGFQRQPERPLHQNSLFPPHRSCRQSHPLNTQNRRTAGGVNVQDQPDSRTPWSSQQQQRHQHRVSVLKELECGHVPGRKLRPKGNGEGDQLQSLPSRERKHNQVEPSLSCPDRRSTKNSRWENPDSVGISEVTLLSQENEASEFVPPRSEQAAQGAPAPAHFGQVEPPANARAQLPRSQPDLSGYVGVQTPVCPRPQVRARGCPETLANLGIKFEQKYCGNPGEDFETFEACFRSYLSFANILSFDVALHCLRNSLKDQALQELVSIQGHCSTIDEVFRGLNQRFGVINPLETALIQIESLAQEQNESHAQWASRVSACYHKAFPHHEGRALARMIANRFCMGLADEKASEVLTNQDHTSVSEALYALNRFKVLKTYQAKRDGGHNKRRAMSPDGVLRQATVSKHPSAHVPEDWQGSLANLRNELLANQRKLAEESRQENRAILNLVNELSTRLSTRGRSPSPRVNLQGRSRSVSPASDRGPLVCYHCHKEGHFARECPEKVTANQFNSLSDNSGGSKTVTFKEVDPKA